MSAKGALWLLQSPRCAREGVSPIPFGYMYGTSMLERMSADVQAWTADRGAVGAGC